jgi:hypothetical protein
MYFSCIFQSPNFWWRHLGCGGRDLIVHSVRRLFFTGPSLCRPWVSKSGILNDIYVTDV